MKVPVVIYASEKLLEKMKEDITLEQIKKYVENQGKGKEL